MKKKDLSIYILTGEDPLYSHLMIEKIFSEYGPHIKGVAFVGGLFSWKRLFYSPFIYGFIRFFILCLKIVLAKFMGGKIEQICLKHNINPLDIGKVNSDQLHSIMKEKGVNLIISINCNQLIKKRLIDLPENGILNIHNSKLPHYRGLMPIVHSIANAESESGISIHYIDNKFDTGPLLAQKTISIKPGDDLFSLWKESVIVGSQMMVDVIRDIENNSVKEIPKEKGEGSYYSIATPKQIFRYRRNILKNKLKIYNLMK